MENPLVSPNIPSDIQTWYWKMHYKWKFLAGTVIELNEEFSSQPRLIARECRKCDLPDS